jgi:mannose-6-phosphate isomerase-like protein (cupin superfamily)
MASITFTQEDLERRIARAKDLDPQQGGFPDSDLPGCHRTLSNILGFRPPAESRGPGGKEVMSPVGSRSSAQSPIDIAEGFNLAFVDATPGNGTILHDHDTNETFVVITGTWRFWCNESDDLSVDLGPLDTISFPPGLPRRFTNVSDTPADQTSRLLVVIAGEQPQAFMEPEVLDAARTDGRFTAARQP